jgi:hypothetical protein
MLMRYTYEIYRSGQRLDITTNFLEVESLLSQYPGSVVNVYDNNAPKRLYSVLTTEDELHGWRDALEKAFAWKDKPITSPIPYNALEETDGFHVAEHPAEPQVVHDFAKATDLFNEVLREIAKGPQHLIDNNAKTAAAVGKPQMSGIPPIALLALGAAMQDGVNKYGLTNWRDSQVSATVFYDAMMRHLLAWYSGEDCAADSHVVHLGHLMAGAAILLDAELHGCLNDNRPKGEHITAESLSFVKR